jgi:hypothetical protein
MLLDTVTGLYTSTAKLFFILPFLDQAIVNFIVMFFSLPPKGLLLSFGIEMASFRIKTVCFC